MEKKKSASEPQAKNFHFLILKSCEISLILLLEAVQLRVNGGGGLSAIDFDHHDQIREGDTNRCHGFLREIMCYFESLTNKNIYLCIYISVYETVIHLDRLQSL